MKRTIAFAIAGLAAGILAALLAAGSEQEPQPAAATAIVALLVGWSYIGSGLLLWRQRPENRLGPVMVFIGFSWFAIYLADTDASVPFTIGTALENVALLGFVYLVLSFPTGRLRSRLDQVLFASAFADAIVVELVWLFFADSNEAICSSCPSNAFQLSRNDDVAYWLLQGQRSVGIVLSLFTVVLLAWRWRRASAPQRRSIAPVLWTGSAMFVALAISIANDIFDEVLGPVPAWTRSSAFGAIPIAVLAVLLQRRLARGAVAGLVVELGAGAETTELAAALGRALGDASLEVAYWVPASERYVDAGGRPVVLPEPGAARVATVLEREGEPIAALVHDAALGENSELVQSVCAAAGLSLENARLQAELRARLAELEASRARLATATETERRRIERDLHDGTQQRLVSIAMSLGLAESKLTTDPPNVGAVLREARETLTIALAELRELTQGIRPAILVERGLAAALDDLGRRAALPVKLHLAVAGRLGEEQEAAGYYVASECLANAAKHSHGSAVELSAVCDGTSLVIEVADDGIGGAGGGGGTGLRGLADRVEALGGTLTLSSPPGRGTKVRAEIPCG